MPHTKSAAIQKLLEIQSRHGKDIQGFPEGMDEDAHYSAGFKHGVMICLISLFEITADDFVSNVSCKPSTFTF